MMENTPSKEKSWILFNYKYRDIEKDFTTKNELQICLTLKSFLSCEANKLFGEFKVVPA